MTSCSLASPTDGYNKGNDLFLTLTHSLYTVTLYINYYNDTTNTTKFTLGHIYTNMTFGLFTNMAPVGSLEHIYIYVPSIRGEVLTGHAPSGSSHFPSGGTCFLTKLSSTTTSTSTYRSLVGRVGTQPCHRGLGWGTTCQKQSSMEETETKLYVSRVVLETKRISTRERESEN